MKHTYPNEVEFHEVSFEDKHVLADWLSCDVWDNFTSSKVSNEMALEWIEQRRFHDNKKTFWIRVGEQNKAGLVQL